MVYNGSTTVSTGEEREEFRQTVRSIKNLLSLTIFTVSKMETVKYNYLKLYSTNQFYRQTVLL